MAYDFLNDTIEKENLVLPPSDKINPSLLKNNNNELIKGIDYLASKKHFLHVHGFLGTGKRQYIDYLCDFINRDVIKLEYYCKEATVCDDILLSFMDVIEKHPLHKAANLNVKITTLKVKLLQQVAAIKKPFLVILHSLDDVQAENAPLIQDLLASLLKEKNVKLIVSTRALKPTVFGELEEDRKIFLKALTKENFKEFLISQQVNATDQVMADFYKYTRGYYFYAALSIKIMQAMKLNLSEFLHKYNQSGQRFDAYLGMTYVNLIPTTVRNFFWLLRTLRHGITIKAINSFELYDDFSIQYLKTNLMIFQAQETIYVQDFFLQQIDISIPAKTEIKIHKYVIDIYEEQLKAPLSERVINLSRQALRAEIEYHIERIAAIEKAIAEEQRKLAQENVAQKQNVKEKFADMSVENQIKYARDLRNAKNYTEAIEAFRKISENEHISMPLLQEVRSELASLYKTIEDYRFSAHYYELLELYYIRHKELINLNYLYYDMTDLYFKMYKYEHAIEIIKKVIYSSNTPQSLFVSSCTLLGNIYSEIGKVSESYEYYEKAIDSLDENVSLSVMAELYFKFALANDDREDFGRAMEYYNKCICIYENNSFRALAYSNMAACYFDNENYDDAKACYKKAYDIEKANNNYDGIYYNASNLAKILSNERSPDTYNFLMEAKKSAEFLNEELYMMESAVALGDYYYNNPETYKDALKEYFSAYKLAKKMPDEIDVSKIESRIEDMKLRMSPKDFQEVERKNAK